MYNNSISDNRNPLWTIDLYCFIRSQESTLLSAVMYTQYIGIDPTHYNIDWYKKTYSDYELNRVNSNFNLAYDSNWDIIKVLF